MEEGEDSAQKRREDVWRGAANRRRAGGLIRCTGKNTATDAASGQVDGATGDRRSRRGIDRLEWEWLREGAVVGMEMMMMVMIAVVVDVEDVDGAGWIRSLRG